MKVGDKLWYNDWREHREWKTVEITGETSRSWLVGWHKTKVNKKTLRATNDYGGKEQYYGSYEDVEAKIFVDKHRGRISEAVKSVSYAQLLQIDKILKGEEK